MIWALVGAVVAAWNVIVDERTATALAATQWDVNEALKRAIVQQSKAAAFGLSLVAFGTALQIVGTILQG
jgi:hypothetical protein